MTAPHPSLTQLAEGPSPPDVLDGAWLRELALSAGADDVAFVSLEHPDLAEEAPALREAFPRAHSLVSFVVKMNRTNVRSPLRSVANRAFHDSGERANHVGDFVARKLEDLGVAALHPSMAFPMEMDRFPGRIWVVSHKRVAQAAGLGRMGVHRNLIHPKFGSFVLLGTVAVDRPIGEGPRPLDYNPCFGCNLCVSACPVGAVKPSGGFDFQACYAHNYREFMGGFVDVLGEVVQARDRDDLARRVPLNEGVSLWQSLTYGANYKAAYCMAVCPAGEDVIGPWLKDKKGHLREVVRPLQAKEEAVFVLPGTDAEAHVRKRYPHKTVRHVNSGIRPQNVEGFLRFGHLAFQPRKAKDVAVRVHFTFTGVGSEGRPDAPSEPNDRDATIAIAGGRIEILDGHVGERDVHVTVDATTWLAIVTGRANPVWAVLRGRLKLRGPKSALDAFSSCFAGAA